MCIIQNKNQKKCYCILIKSLLIETAALRHEVAKIQEKIKIVKEERKCLRRKLSEYKKKADKIISYYSQKPLNISNEPRTKSKKRRSTEEVIKNA
ncbi:unnamed protein product, partial [Brenthis ino]